MQSVRVYTTSYCGYCRRAKTLLADRGIPFEEIDVTNDEAARAWLLERTRRHTVPQVFIGEEAVGGYDDLCELDRSGELQRKLSAG